MAKTSAKAPAETASHYRIKLAKHVELYDGKLFVPAGESILHADALALIDPALHLDPPVPAEA